MVSVETILLTTSNVSVALTPFAAFALLFFPLLPSLLPSLSPASLSLSLASLLLMLCVHCRGQQLASLQAINEKCMDLQKAKDEVDKKVSTKPLGGKKRE